MNRHVDNVFDNNNKSEKWLLYHSLSADQDVFYKVDNVAPKQVARYYAPSLIYKHDNA